jgi:organic hydroperoxide reductase OsmC/OhrA
MATYGCTVSWRRGGADFAGLRYGRGHEWRFDGGAVVRASASPLHVPAPFSDPAGVDPEEALVAATSSCHMLWFLSLAAGRGLTVDSYEDAAEGVLGTDAAGRKAITRIVLRPDIRFAPARVPGADEIGALHREAHARCFIAASLSGEVVVEPPAAKRPEG